MRSGQKHPVERCSRKNPAGSRGASRRRLHAAGRHWLFALLGAMAAVRAQEPLNPAVPLMRAPVAVSSPGTGAVNLASAQRAQELGLPSVAANLYRQLLGAPGADRAGLTLALATALVDDGRGAEAEQALESLAEPRGAAWHLRAGLAAMQLKKIDAAKLEVAAIKAEELSAADRAWSWFLQGALFDMAPVRDLTRANEFYTRAEAAATTDLARLRFQLAAEQVRLRLAAPTRAQIDADRKDYESNLGRAQGYSAARNYAVALDAAGRKDEAVAILQEALLTLPAGERARRDDFQFLLGLIANRGRDGAGRNALIKLIETGNDPDRQRQALQLLADASQTGPARAQFRAELTKLATARPPHPMLESLLLFSAQAALAANDHKQAEDDANAMLQKFPGSALRVHAYGVLTGSAWEQGRYRLAATNAQQARAELATSTAGSPAERAEAGAKLGVLVAEAWFRAGDTDDFRNAADAYAAVLRERPAGVPPGDLMFQRVLAEIKSGSPNAAKVLDEVEAEPAFDPENRWQAEWSLARELQTRGDDGVKQAYARVNQLLAAAPALSPSNGPAGAAVPAELRARMAWLQARLSFQAGEPERTLDLVKKLDDLPGGLDAALQAEIKSKGAVLNAEANFKLGSEATEPKIKRDRETAALEILDKLRKDPSLEKSEAAAASYLVEADYYASPGQNQISKAQQKLKSLADDFPTSVLAPYALYQAAVQVAKLGQEDNYKEADRLLVELVKRYPQSDLVFAAKLKEGELLEQLNQLPQAQQVYQELENKFPRHKDVTLAQLALARSLNAQAADNAAYLDEAQARFTQLRDRVDAPVDVRVEAGYNLGDLLARRGAPDKATVVWWNDVVEPFLLKDPAVAARLLDPAAKGRYWMARTLVRLGEMLEKQEKFEEAKRAWTLILETKLGYPGEALAKEKLKRFGFREVKP